MISKDSLQKEENSFCKSKPLKIVHGNGNRHLDWLNSAHQSVSCLIKSRFWPFGKDKFPPNWPKIKESEQVVVQSLKRERVSSA